MLISQIDKYKNGKDVLERNILDRLSSHVLRWKEQGKRVAIYGAGLHTKYLLNLFDLSETVTAILDSDPEKHGKKADRARRVGRKPSANSLSGWGIGIPIPQPMLKSICTVSLMANRTFHHITTGQAPKRPTHH